MAPDDPRRTVRALLDAHGRAYADEAGIRLTDKPGPLYQLLVLATLLSARITAGVAVAAARELFRAGCRSPRAMLAATWQDRVDALGRGHYRRYDERTATMLGDGAQLCQDRWRGDLRRLHAEAGSDPGALQRLLVEFPGHRTDGRRHLPPRGAGGLAGHRPVRRREGPRRRGPAAPAHRA